MTYRNGGENWCKCIEVTLVRVYTQGSPEANIKFCKHSSGGFEKLITLA